MHTVVSAAYCYPQPVDLILQEGVNNGLNGGDAFAVYDSQGRVLFK